MLGLVHFLFIGTLIARAFASMAQTPLQVENEVCEPEAEEESWSMNSATFHKTYSIEFEKEWEVDGQVPEWAPSTSGRPLKWGEESRSMKLVDNGRKGDEPYLNEDQMAVSPDGKFIALATTSIIRIYDMADHKLIAELAGHLGPIESMMFAPRVPDTHPDAQYLILSQGSDRPGVRYQDETIIVWYLDGEGRVLGTTAPFEVETLADKATSAISQDLTRQHQISAEAIDDIRKAFSSALKTADTKNRQASLTSFKGKFTGYSPRSTSSNGALVLILTHNDSTQSGMRPVESLPQITIRSLDNPAAEPVAILQGHTDAIMWASFSPTDPSILASAAWDGTYRIWDISTKPATTRHVITPPKKRQNWSGAFSPDGEHILLSGTDNVGIYSVSTGEKLFTLTTCEAFKVASWTRSLSWNPVSNAIALASGAQVLLWEPFDEAEPNKCSAVVTLDGGKTKKERMFEIFKEFRTVSWLNGDVLAAKAADDSWLLWDRKQNVKWRFQKPKGADGELWATDCALVQREGGKRVFVTLDSDRTLREWVLD